MELGINWLAAQSTPCAADKCALIIILEVMQK